MKKYILASLALALLWPYSFAGAAGIAISDLLQGVSQDQIVASWKTSVPGTSELYYRTSFGEDDFVRAKDPALVTDHQIKTAKLPAGFYEFYIQSVAADGSVARSRIIEVSHSHFYDPIAQSGQTLAYLASGQKRAVKLTYQAIPIKDQALYKRIKGRIILRVERAGEAYWVNPQKQEMYYLGRPDDAFALMRQRGVGISEANITKIQPSLSQKPSGSDKDGDGLPDSLEDALGTDKSKKDTDGDKHDDKTELLAGFDPKKGGNAKLPIDKKFGATNLGRIFLSVERNGEAWYISPADQKRYFLGRPLDAFNVMRAVGMGIAEKDFGKL